MDLKKIDTINIKALCFDELVKIETAQNNLKLLNDELIRRNQEKVTKKEVTSKEEIKEEEIPAVSDDSVDKK